MIYVVDVVVVARIRYCSVCVLLNLNLALSFDDAKYPGSRKFIVGGGGIICVRFVRFNVYSRASDSWLRLPLTESCRLCSGERACIDGCSAMPTSRPIRFASHVLRRGAGGLFDVATVRACASCKRVPSAHVKLSLCRHVGFSSVATRNVFTISNGSGSNFLLGRFGGRFLRVDLGWCRIPRHACSQNAGVRIWAMDDAWLYVEYEVIFFFHKL